MPKAPRSHSRGRSTTRKRAPSTAKDTTPPAPSSRASSIFPSRQGQKLTLFDAVAGHVTPHGLITAPSYHVPSYYRDVPAHGAQKVLRPGEVLGGSKGGSGGAEEGYAMHRFLVGGVEEKARAERTIEDANAREPLVDGLTPDEDEDRAEDGRWEEEEVQRLKSRVKIGNLPDSDLLKAVHTFTSLFYEACGSHFDFRSLDETALLACGILLEETVRDELRENADLVFLEGAEDRNREPSFMEASDALGGATRGKSRKEKQDDSASSEVSQTDTEKEQQTIKDRSKRRKIDEDAQSRFGEDW